MNYATHCGSNKSWVWLGCDLGMGIQFLPVSFPCFHVLSSCIILLDTEPGRSQIFTPFLGTSRARAAGPWAGQGDGWWRGRRGIPLVISLIMLLISDSLFYLWLLLSCAPLLVNLWNHIFSQRIDITGIKACACTKVETVTLVYSVHDWLWLGEWSKRWINRGWILCLSDSSHPQIYYWG